MLFNAISFNIRCCNDPNGNSVKERASRLKKIIFNYNPDIIGFQEHTPLWEPYICEDYGEEYEIFNIYRAKNELESSPILWKSDKFEFVKADYFWLSDTPNVESRGWDEIYNCYRMCVCVKLIDKSEGKILNVINTHFGFGDNGQVKSVNLINEFCQKLSNEPICILGDFNMTPESIAYNQMIKYFHDVNAITVKDYSETFHGYNPGSNKGEHIDYCFINDSIKSKSYHVINEKVNNKYPSDHFGLFLQLQI